MRLFGIEIKRAAVEKKLLKSFTVPENNDGSIVQFDNDVMGAYGAGAFGAEGFGDLGARPKKDAMLITKYRAVAQQHEIELAIDDIVNEAITPVEDGQSVTLNADRLEGISKNIRKKIVEEFDTVYALFDFNNSGYEAFRRWYVDGRSAYHIVVDKNNLKGGIQELRYIDPRKIKKIKKIKTETTGGAGTENQEVTLNIEIEEYFIYSEDFMKQQEETDGLKISKDSVIWGTSGLMAGEQVISYLDKAIKPLNQLRILEDSAIIYRVTRAPERRVFYIDVGNLPPAKAEQYLTATKDRHKNKTVYDKTDGTIKNAKSVMTMAEDYWLPRRDGGRSTEIDTLAGGQNLGDIDDILFFQKKLYKSLNVPISRMDTEAQFTLGKSQETTRDEIKFYKFIQRLRNRFALLFSQALEKQLILKGIITSADWAVMKNRLLFVFEDDSHFAELKEAEVRRGRFEDASLAEEFIGLYISREYVYKNVLMMSEEEMEYEQERIAEEKELGWIEDEDDFGDDGGDGGGDGGGSDDEDEEDEEDKDDEPVNAPAKKDDEEDEDEKKEERDLTVAATKLINEMIESDE